MSKVNTLPKPPLFTEKMDSKPIRRPLTVRLGAGKRATSWVTVVHKEDPRKALLSRIGEIPTGVVQFSRILVAIYTPPVVEKTEGGVFIGAALQDEDKEEAIWQGKVGLIVAAGPQAYKDDDTVRFHGTENKVGDWVWFRPSDGQAVLVNEVHCRLFFEKDIIGRLPHPDFVF